MAGLYIVVARGNMVKKLVGLSIFQTSVYLLYIAPGKIIGGTAPIIDPAFTVYSNPLPHVLILTAIVVGVATLALGLALVVRINEAYGTIEEDEIFGEGPRDMNAVWPHLPALQVVVPLLGAVLAALLRRPAAAFALAAGRELDRRRSSPIALLWQVLRDRADLLPSRRLGAALGHRVPGRCAERLRARPGLGGRRGHHAVRAPVASPSRSARTARPGSTACTCCASPACSASPSPATRSTPSSSSRSRRSRPTC